MGISPKEYEAASVLMLETAKEMISRLEWMTLQPANILDLGCHLGECVPLLEARYPQAKIVSANTSKAMLAHAQQKLNRDGVLVEQEKLPFQNQQFDLITVNLFSPGVNNLNNWLQELQRVLRPQGLLIFTALGPDSMQELDESCQILPQRLDMHNLGDAVFSAGFQDPVFDVEYITLTYKTPEHLLKEASAMGFITNQNEAATLKKNENDVYPVTYEIVHAHAWAGRPGASMDESTGEAKFPLSLLRQRLRGSN